jgi:hypothetical protein
MALPEERHHRLGFAARDLGTECNLIRPVWIGPDHPIGQNDFSSMMIQIIRS